MPGYSKKEYPPLLVGANLCNMSVAEVEQLCVADERFELSSTRDSIMIGLKTIIDRIQAASLDAELWIDGSFVTAKIDPDDVDIILWIYDDEKTSPTKDQVDLVNWLTTDLKADYHCHSFVFFRYDKTSAHYGFGERRFNECYDFFTVGRGTQPPKGVPVVDCRK